MWIRFSLRHHRHHFFRNYFQRNMHMNQSQGNLSGLSNPVFPYLLVSPVTTPTTPPPPPSTTTAGTTNQECKKLYAELFIPSIVSNSIGDATTDNQGGGGDCKQRRYCFKLPIHETVSAFLSNLVSTINSAYLKGNYPTVDRDTVYLATQADLLFHKSAKESNTLTEFNKTKTLEDCFLSDCCTEQILLQINFCLPNNPEKTTSLVYQVQRNPARMFRCQLNTIPMVGYPMLPCIEGENICLEKSEFLWFVGQPKQWPEQPCHKGFVFIPDQSHLGLLVQLRVRIRDANGKDGSPYGVNKFYTPYGQPIECKSPVLKPPVQEFHEQRYKLIRNDEMDSQRLRVVSYNILAEVYVRSDLARTSLFQHCPENFTSSAYRLPLILHELYSYQSDIICLQEVDRWIYERYLSHGLKCYKNMNSLFLAKRAVLPDPNNPAKVKTDMEKEKGEGCAIFYSSSRFELVSQFYLPSILDYASTVPFLSNMLANLTPADFKRTSSEEHSFNEEDVDVHIQKSLSQCLVVGVFRTKSSPSSSSSPALFIVANTHFYFHPSASSLRLIQAHTVRHYLLKLAMEYNQASKKPIPIIFCGDINQSPGTTVYHALTTGNNNNNDNPIYSSQGKTAYQPIFESVYANNPPEFTNWVPKFNSTLDVILYNTDSELKCTRFMPIDSLKQMKQRIIQQMTVDNAESIPDEDKLGLPNAYFPSDHIALVADFSWNALRKPGDHPSE
ncbi:unnamed protein product [Trichobilharzia szidati]|nr:unnamed protein product [Trichobilharzia szidati]